jgi:hypothetical protein
MWQIMNKKHLREFLTDANKAGFASGELSKIIEEKDGSKTICYESGDWKFHDNYFGGEPYGGREVIFFKNKPVWMMVYYGWVNKGVRDLDAVYAFLQNVLKQMPREHPYRGPKKYLEGTFRYENKLEGDLVRFRGEEIIFRKGKEIYQARYMGGLVDQ